MGQGEKLVKVVRVLLRSRSCLRFGGRGEGVLVKCIDSGLVVVDDGSRVTAWVEEPSRFGGKRLFVGSWSREEWVEAVRRELRVSSGSSG